MGMLSKYENFLVDKEVYFASRRFWNDTIDTVNQEPHEQWVITQFANGIDFLDGNPITSALYKQRNKAIRIIQVAADNQHNPIWIWVESVDYQSILITELVLVIQPRDDVYQRAMDVLTFFLFEPDLKKISRYVKAFNAINRQAVSLKRSIDAMRSINPVGTGDLIRSTIETIYDQGAKRKKQST